MANRYTLSLDQPVSAGSGLRLSDTIARDISGLENLP
jgi:hypothetical protein